jgi:very-short-patch-repair endonuclease
VYRAYCRGVGRRDSAAVGPLLIAAADRADSAAERIVVRLLREAGIGGWVLGHPFGPYTIDVAFPDARLAIEVDGWAWHVDQDRFVGDRRKGNALVRAGWTVLRFTWHDVTRSPGTVVPRSSRPWRDRRVRCSGASAHLMHRTWRSCRGTSAPAWSGRPSGPWRR